LTEYNLSKVVKCVKLLYLQYMKAVILVAVYTVDKIWKCLVGAIFREKNMALGALVPKHFAYTPVIFIYN